MGRIAVVNFFCKRSARSLERKKGKGSYGGEAHLGERMHYAWKAHYRDSKPLSPGIYQA